MGFEEAVRRRYGRVWALVALACVLAVNVLTLAANIEGGSAALGLLTGWPYEWFNLPFAAALDALVIWGDWGTLKRVLGVVLLVFVAYVAAAFLAHPHWHDVLFHTVVPHYTLSAAYVAGAIALLGTTLTSYVYIWETIEEAAERTPIRLLRLARLEAYMGVVVAGMLFWFIVVATGATLGIHHGHVQTAQDAAQALAPIAGRFAALLFGVGLLASAVLAVPVIACTSAYVMAEAFGWRHGLNLGFHTARRFYLALLITLAIGVALTSLRINPT